MTAQTLSQDQEESLAKAIETALYAQHLKEQNLPSNASTTELEKLITDGQDAFWQLFEANLGLVRTTAKRFARNPSDEQDYFQEGCLGLVDAIRHFDYAKRIRFSSYALYWIKQFMFSLMYQAQGLSEYGSKSRMQTLRTKNLLESRYRRSVSASEISRVRQVPKAIVVRDLCRPCLPVEDMNQVACSEDFSPQVVDRKQKSDQWRRVCLAFETLDGLSRRVLRALFGFGDAPASYQQVARSMQISLSTVRRIERRALAEIKAYLTQFTPERTQTPTDSVHQGSNRFTAKQAEWACG